MTSLEGGYCLVPVPEGGKPSFTCFEGNGVGETIFYSWVDRSGDEPAWYLLGRVKDEGAARIEFFEHVTHPFEEKGVERFPVCRSLWMSAQGASSSPAFPTSSGQGSTLSTAMWPSSVAMERPSVGAVTSSAPLPRLRSHRVRGARPVTPWPPAPKARPAIPVPRPVSPPSP
jgi:hypothetical protein